MKSFLVYYSNQDGCYVAHEENHPNIMGMSVDKIEALENAKREFDAYQNRNKLNAF